MNLIKRLFLLIALVLTIFTTNNVLADELKAVDFGGTISAVKNLENDFLNSKDNELSFASISQTTSSISSRRNGTNGDTNDKNSDYSTELTSEKISYFTYKNLYLINNNELALQLLFHQIQPNAP